LGILLASLAVIILLRTFFVTEESEASPWRGITVRKILRVVFVLLCTAAYTFLLNKLGFLVATFLFTLILLKIAESYSWLASFLIAGSASAGNFLIFRVWLQGQFPKGWLGI
jgi:putative tricarboxylic transport membrane protein